MKVLGGSCGTTGERDFWVGQVHKVGTTSHLGRAPLVFCRHLNCASSMPLFFISFCQSHAVSQEARL